MKISVEKDGTFLSECCFCMADKHNKKQLLGLANDRVVHIDRDKARMSGEKQIKMAMDNRDIVFSASKKDYEKDTYRSSARTLYNPDGEHARISDIYPLVKCPRSARGESVKRYEWQVFLRNKWLPYKHSLGKKLEKLFCYTSCQDLELLSHRFRRNWWKSNGPGEYLTINYRHYKICPLFMLQRNLRTGKERPIRRMKIERDFALAAADKCYPRRRAHYPDYPSHAQYKMHFRGSKKNPRNDTVRKSNKVRSYDKLKSKKKSPPEWFFEGDLLRSKGFDQETSDQTSSSSIVSCVSDEKLGNVNYFPSSSNEELVEFLWKLHLEKYYNVFRANNVSVQQLVTANLRYLVVDLGIPKEQSKQILWAIKGQKCVSSIQYEQSPTSSPHGKGGLISASPSIYTLSTLKDQDSGVGIVGKYCSYDEEHHQELHSSGAESIELTEVCKPVQKQGSRLKVYSDDFEPSCESVGSVGQISDGTFTYHEQYNTAEYEPEDIVMPKYVSPPGYTEVQIDTTNDDRFISHRSNITQTIQGLNEMYKDFITDEIRERVMTDRESYTVSPAVRHISSPSVDGIPNLNLQPQLRSTKQCIPPETERKGNRSIDNDERKKTKCPSDMTPEKRISSMFPPAELFRDRRGSDSLIIESDDKSSSVRDCSSVCSEDMYGEMSCNESYSSTIDVVKEESAEEASKVTLSDMITWYRDGKAYSCRGKTKKIYN